MIKADKIFLAKTIFDYLQAVEEIQGEIVNTSELLNSIIKSLEINDNRLEESLMYQENIRRLLRYAHMKQISESELLDLVEEYKKLNVIEYLELKKNVTIQNELDIILIESF